MFDLMPFRRRRSQNQGENENRLPTDDFFDAFRSANLLDDFMNVTRSGFRTDIKETEDSFILEAELPGLRKEDITLEVEDDLLTIAIEEEETVEEKEENYLHRERRTGSYQRSFQIQNVKEDEI